MRRMPVVSSLSSPSSASPSTMWQPGLTHYSAAMFVVRPKGAMARAGNCKAFCGAGRLCSLHSLHRGWGFHSLRGHVVLHCSENRCEKKNTNVWLSMWTGGHTDRQADRQADGRTDIDVRFWGLFTPDVGQSPRIKPHDRSVRNTYARRGMLHDLLSTQCQTAQGHAS